MKKLGPLAVLAVGFVAALAPMNAEAAWISTGTGQGQATATSVDKAATPTVAKSPRTTPGSTTVVPTVSLSWAATTLASGVPVGSYEVRRHSDSGYTVVCTVSAPATSCDDTAPLMDTVTYGVVARVGANWVGPESELTSFKYDNVAPVTTATQSPAPNAAGWNNSDTTVTLNATDAESGVKSISYTVGGSTATVSGSTASVPVSTEGTTTISYSATDRAGNTETSKTFTVQLDKSAPTVTASAATASGGTSYSPVTLSLSATDGGSGVQSISYQVGTAPAVTATASSASPTISANGSTTVQYWATDTAGNESAHQTYTVTIATNPTPAPSGLIGLTDGGNYSTHDASSGWARICNGAGAICVGAGDQASSIANVTYTLHADSGDHSGSCWVGGKDGWGSACSSLSMTLGSDGVYRGDQVDWKQMGSGSYTLTIVATDKAGHQGTPTTISFTTTTAKIDGQ